MTENMWCLVSGSCVSLLGLMVSSFIYVPAKDMNSSFFYGCIVFHRVYVPQFLCPLMGIWVGSKSLLLQTVPQWTYVSIYLYNKTIYNALGIYSAMGLLGQIVFLVLEHWWITTLSSTMVELIYTPTNSAKAFLFLQIICSSWCFLTSIDFHSNWHEMVSYCGFDFHLSNDQWWSAFFICLLAA